MRTMLGDYRKKMANEDKAIKFGNKLIHFIINIKILQNTEIVN